MKRNTGFRLVMIRCTMLLQVFSTSSLYASSADHGKQEQGEEVYEPHSENKQHIKKAEEHVAKSSERTHESDQNTHATKDTEENSTSSEHEEGSSSEFEEQDSAPSLTENPSGEKSGEPKSSHGEKPKDNIKLKEFTKKLKNKDKKTNGKEVQKLQNTKQDSVSKSTPIELKEQNQGTEKVEGVIEEHNEPTDEAETEIKVEHNKIAEADHKVIEHNRFHGIIWFFSVFIVLIIVIFAFT